jgi:tetratricopeptide (TPR) repeat protein
VSASLANAERVRAETSASEADTINKFVQDFLDALNPRNSHGRGVDRALMERADQMLSTRFARQPRAEASIRAALGRNMLALGPFATAEAQLKRALDLLTAGEPGPQALAVMQQLAEVYRERGNIAGAFTLSNRVVEILTHGNFGANSTSSAAPTTVPTPSTRPAWAAPEALEAINTLANTLNDLGRPEDAEEMCRRTLLLSGNIARPQDLDAQSQASTTLALVRTLGRLLRLSTEPTRLAEAESWTQRLVSAWAARSKPADVESADDPETLEARHDLAAVYSAQKRWGDAVNLFRTVVTAGPASLGPDHPDLVIWQNDLAAALIQRGLPGDAPEAERICRAILPAATEVRGGEHLQTVTLLMNLANALHCQGKRTGAEVTYRQAESYASRAVEQLTHASDSPNPQALRLLDALVVTRSYLRDWEGAEAASRQALTIRREVFGPNRRQTLMNALNLGRVLFDAGNPQEARAVLTPTLKACQLVFPPDDELTAQVKEAIGKLPEPK